MGFFSASSLPVVSAPVSTIPQCGKCGLWRKCRSPKMPVYGKGKKGILIYGEAPGKSEDDRGRPFCGQSGQRLRRTLEEVGIDMDRDCWLANSIRCRPADNRTPTDKEVEFCRPFLLNDVKALNPTVIIPLGGTAVKSVIGWLWEPNPGPVSRWVGWKIPSQQLNAWVTPTFHPSYLLRQESPVADRMFLDHLDAAVTLSVKRPWEEVPDYKRDCHVITDDEAACDWIGLIECYGEMVSIDFETNMLKPDSAQAEIVCVSMSNGEKSVCFPWRGHAIEAFKDFLRSDIPKVGFNIKFEDKWARKVMGVRVKGWLWDGMIAAHVLDNRRGITGLGFQSFVRLGLPPYYERVSPFLASKEQGGNSVNQIRKCDFNQLALYCAIDSLVEWKLAEIQMKELGVN